MKNSTIATLACNGLWTRQRQAEAGYIVPDTLCALCGLETDTLEHRLLWCQHVAAQREELV